MAKHKAPTDLTSGAGFGFEDFVAARLLLDMLCGMNTLGTDWGRMRRVDWQARDMNWHADDLAISCQAEHSERAAGISIKSDKQVTSTGFPSNFVRAAWEHWLGAANARPLVRDRDIVALVTGDLAGGVKDAWNKTLGEALATAPERMVARLGDPKPNERAQSSKLQRDLFASLHRPADLGASDAHETALLLRHLRLLHFDYDSTPSNDEIRSVRDARQAVTSNSDADARRLWRRLVAVAAEKRRVGGMLDLPALLNILRADFQLRIHPDFEADWSRLVAASIIGSVRDHIEGIDVVQRDAPAAEVMKRLTAAGICYVVGESGCGKSALAKHIATREFPHVFWPEPDQLDVSTADALGMRLGLRNPIATTLASAVGPCLVVIDGLEGHSQRALSFVADLVAKTRETSAASHVKFLLVSQGDAATRVLHALARARPDLRAVGIYELPRPPLEEIRRVVEAVPALAWASLRPELQALLTNLKVLDLVVSTVRVRGFDPGSTDTLSGLIDQLWSAWISDRDNGYVASALLMRLGQLDGDSLSAGTPQTSLTLDENRVSGDLTQNGLLTFRDERFYFAHDLIGDWARLRCLVGTDPTASSSSRQLAARPKWSRAVRLLGQRKLELGGVEAWYAGLVRASDGSDAGAVVSDLLLEALFLAGSSARLLDAAWSRLTENDGQLLRRLLDRFLIVATLPDPRLSPLGRAASALSHLLRVPIAEHWGPLLQQLRARLSDVVRLGAGQAGHVATVWLRSPPMARDSEPDPETTDAAELALAIAREFQACIEEGGQVDQDEAATVFEGLLLAARVRPGDVATLCLELAQRNGLRADVAARVKDTRTRAERELQQWRETHAQEAAEQDEQDPPPEFIDEFLSPNFAPPWPDGPRTRVASPFRKACLNSGAFQALIDARPDVAREVLLAVCIEEPQREGSWESSARDSCGLNHWRAGAPPLYDRGPFLGFLRRAPEEALEFTFRLINFATARLVEVEKKREAEHDAYRRLRRSPSRPDEAWLGERESMDGIEVDVGDSVRRWPGDRRVLRWYHDWPHESKLIPCCLMALEAAIRERIAHGEDVAPALARILDGSQSLAFAGLLIDLGKSVPLLLKTTLRPLLRSWRVMSLDLKVIERQHGEVLGLMFDGGDARRRAWFEMAHRRIPLVDVVAPALVLDPDMAVFFAETRATWNKQLADRDAQGLPILIARMDPANYVDRSTGGEHSHLFRLPKHLQEMSPASARKLEHAQILTTTMRCRRILDEGVTSLPPLQLDVIDALARGYADLWIPEGREDPQSVLLADVIDATCGCVAVLLCTAGENSTPDAERDTLCRSVLAAWSARAPAAVDDADLDHSEAFVAEAAAALLAKDPGDPLARELVASSTCSVRHEPTAACSRRAFRLRAKLGLDFPRLMHMVVISARIRFRMSLEAYAFGRSVEPHLLELQASLSAFVDRSLPADLPSIATTSDAALSDLTPTDLLGAMQARASFPLDGGVLRSGLCWLNLSAASSPQEQAEWLELVRDLVHASTRTGRQLGEREGDAESGLPRNFDQWVMELASASIRTLGPGPAARTLWQPYLDLPLAAHSWVAGFLWQWLSVADLAQDQSRWGLFFDTWAEMLAYASGLPMWDPATSWADLADVVGELLGLRFGRSSIAGNQAVAPLFAKHATTFSAAASRWVVIPRVCAEYAAFLSLPGTRPLRLLGLHLIAAALPSVDDYEWTNPGLADSTVGFLRACWDDFRLEVSEEAAHRESFVGALNALVARSSHAATALRDEVLNHLRAAASARP